MRRNFIDSGFAFALLVAATMSASVAGAEETLGEVTVRGVREEPAGHTAHGVPIIIATQEQRVSFADISLTTDSGVKVLETRVRDAARSICDSLEAKYPVAAAGEKDCYKTAVESAMVDAHKAIDAAKRNTVAAQ
jgi:UrcA family protein